LIGGLIGGSLIRNRLLASDRSQSTPVDPDETSRTLGQALRSQTFWTFTITTSFYGLVVAGTSLWGQRVLAERQFDKEVFVNLTRIGVIPGLAANLFVGWLATKFPLNRLIGVATAALAGTLFVFPYLKTKTEVYAYGIALAATGGAITVCFFTVYRQAFGPRHLGKIQGVAQMATVLFSAVGPLVFSRVLKSLGTYTPLFPTFAGIALVLALTCFLFRLPVRQTSNAGAA
jgi:cyanate permease